MSESRADKSADKSKDAAEEPANDGAETPEAGAEAPKTMTGQVKMKPVVAKARATQPEDEAELAPVLEQQDDAANFEDDSGVLKEPVVRAALAMANLINRRISPESLRQHLSDRPGLNSTARALEASGLPTRVSSKRKIRNIAPKHLPCVLEMEGGEALVLIRFITRDRVQVWRPESGEAETVELPPIQSRYTGKLLRPLISSEAGNRFELAALADRKGWFLRTLTSFWPVYGHVLVVSLLINCFALTIPLFIMNVYDRVVPNQAIASLWALAIGVFLALGFDFLFRNLRNYFIDHAGRTADSVIASRLMGQLLALKMKERQGQVGALASTMREYENVREFFASSTLSALIDLPFVFLFIGVIYLLSGPLAYVALAAVPLVLLFSLIMRLPMRRLTERSLQDSGNQHGILVEAASGLETVKSTAAEGIFMDRWDRAVSRSSETNRGLRTFFTLSTTFTQFVVQMSTVVVVIWGVYLIRDGEISVGALVAATILTGRALAPLGLISNMLIRLQQSMSSLKRLDAFMHLEFEDYGANRLSSILQEGGIEMRSLAFTYPGQRRRALNGLNVRIKPGERVAIIGRIGSGKSTIARLLVGLYEPEEGNISLNGIDLAQYNPSDLRRHVGYVGQENFLFSGTIRENISVGAPTADDDAIRRAADLAGVSDFVRTLPDGFETQVGERGGLLSGGQRQAITLARALVLLPKILILDEPSSQMDQGSEARMRQRLNDYVQGKTLVVITHRSSLLALVERLIVIDGGRVVADGPKDQVLADLNKGRVRAAV